MVQVVGAAFALALTLAACGGDAPDESADADGASGGTSAAASAPASGDGGGSSEPSSGAGAATATADGPATVAVDKSDDYGRMLVDGDGLALYVFFSDAEDTSTCYDACAENWPPLLTDGDAKAKGKAKGGLLGTTERDDGTTQVTYDGQPLYYYTDDTEPGDVLGYGNGDVWYPVAPDGLPIDNAEVPSEGVGGGY